MGGILKKFFICASLIFLVIFCLAASTVKGSSDKLYSLLYPDEKPIIEKSSSDIVELKDGDYFVCGEYGGEPLVWKCVLNNKAQCDKIIEFRAYDNDSSDWETLDLRRWLNSDSGFYGNALLNKEKIIDGEVYILSQKELEKIGDRGKAPTLYAIRNSKSKYFFLRKNCWYWTSSSISTNTHSVAAVTQNGSFYKTLSSDELTGVCPAFTLKTKTLAVLGGDGSRLKPYVIG